MTDIRRIETQPFTVFTAKESVYKIKCGDWQSTYVGETGRNLNIRLTEHKRMVISIITFLSAICKRRIDWDCLTFKFVTYGTDYYERVALKR